jgi:hypothetical protein
VCKQVERRKLINELDNKLEEAKKERMELQQQEVTYLHEKEILWQQMRSTIESYEVSQNGPSPTKTRIITFYEDSKILC